MVKNVTLRPSRIGCPSIPGTMKGVALSVRGVIEVRVRYTERALDIIYEESETSPQDIIKKIGEEIGLRMDVAEEKNTTGTENVSETCPM